MEQDVEPINDQVSDNFDLDDQLDKDTQGAGTFSDPGDPDDYTLEDEDQPIKTLSECRRDAKAAVDLMDGLQTTVLKRYVYPKTILEKGDKDKLRRYFDENERSEDVFEAHKRYLKLVEYSEALPFEKEDKERIIKPLSRIIHKYQTKTLSPEWTLVLAVLIVMLPRLQPLFPSIFSGIESFTGNLFGAKKDE